MAAAPEHIEKKFGVAVDPLHSRSTLSRTGTAAARKWPLPIPEPQEKGIPMRFLCIYKPGKAECPPTPEAMAEMGRLVEEAMKAGWLLATEGCLPSSAGARVRLENGSFTITDGPFPETKELIGGFAIVKAASKEEAIRHTQYFLNVAGGGETEIRQLCEAPEQLAAAC
jgi:hypothetical protein